MYPLIGIIMREGTSEAGHKINYVYCDIEKAIINSGGIPMGINRAKLTEYLNICSGFIMEGGSEFSKQDFEAIKAIKSKNKPLLGICLGMQEMAYLHNGIIKDIKGHMNTNHIIQIDPDSLLHKIIGKEKIMVNSRHKSAITKTDLLVSAYDNNNIIEAIEDPQYNFFLGLEWHPENTYHEDINSQKIFDYFIKVCHDTK